MKRFSKAFCLLLVVSMLLSLVAVAPGKAAAEGETSGKCGENIDWVYEEASAVLTLEGEGAMPNFEKEEELPWAAFADQIKKVVIKSGIMTVGKNAFAGCTAMEEVVLPDTLVAVEEVAFKGCESLTKVDLSETKVAVIAAEAFSGCTAVEEVVLPATLKSLEEGAFKDCESLTKVDLSETKVAVIEADTFAGCAALTEVNLPETIENVDEKAFVGAESLETVTVIGDSVTVDELMKDVELPESTEVVAIEEEETVVVDVPTYPVVPVIPVEPTVPSEEPTAPSEEPTEPSEEPTEPSEEPTAPSEEPTEPSEEPTAPSEEPTEPSEEPTAPSEEPTEPSEEPTAPSEEPTEPSEEPTAPSEEPTEPSEEPTAPSEEPTEPSEEPTAPSEEPTEPSEEPTAPSEEPTEPSEEPTTPSEEPTEPSEEPTEPQETTVVYEEDGFEITETRLGDETIKIVRKSLTDDFMTVESDFVANGCPAKVEYLEGGKVIGTSTMTWSADGLLMKEHYEGVDGFYNDTTYNYDSTGLLVSDHQLSSEGFEINHYYDADGKMTHGDGVQPDGREFQIKYEQYSNGMMKSETWTFADSVSVTEYNEEGKLVKSSWDNQKGNTGYTLYGEKNQIVETGWQYGNNNGVTHYVDGVQSTGEYYQNGKLFSTTVYECDANGKPITCTTNFVRGGKSIDYYSSDNGFADRTEDYDAFGNLTGVRTAEFDEDGNIAKTTYVSYGMGGGTTIMYYENGNMNREEFYYEGILRYTTTYELDENGQRVKGVRKQENGGYQYFYYEDGFEVKVETYSQNGELSGIIEMEWENGTMVRQVYEGMGMKQVWLYDDNGRIIKQEDYRDGQLIGASEYVYEYDENGEVVKETCVGLISGAYSVSYYEQGHVVKTENYDYQGILMGIVLIEWKGNVQVSYTGMSADGSEKNVTKYDDLGNMILSERYVNGELQYRDEYERDENGAAIKYTSTYSDGGKYVAYYENGRTVKSENYDRNGNLTSIQTYEWNGDRQVGYSREDADGSRKYTAKYDLLGNFLLEESYEYGELQYRNEYERDENGQELMAAFTYSDGRRDVLHYENGHRVKIEGYDENGVLFHVQTEVWDGDHVVSSVAEDTDGSTKIYMEYDLLGNATLQEYYEYGELVSCCEYERDADGTITKATYWNPGSCEVNVFENGNLVKAEVYDGNGKLVNTSIRVWDDGRLVSSVDEAADGSSKVIMEYDRNGYASLQEYYEYGELYARSEYERDEFGFITKATTWTPDALVIEVIDGSFSSSTEISPDGSKRVWYFMDGTNVGGEYYHADGSLDYTYTTERDEAARTETTTCVYSDNSSFQTVLDLEMMHTCMSIQRDPSGNVTCYSVDDGFGSSYQYTYSFNEETGMWESSYWGCGDYDISDGGYMGPAPADAPVDTPIPSPSLMAYEAA